MLFRHCIFVLLLACSACATPPDQTQAQSNTLPQRILFVGNSFTYYNNSLHNHLRRLMSAGGISNEQTRARIMTISGGRLPEHVAGLPAMVQSEDWDIVVLQGHSKGPISEETAQPFTNAATKLAKVIRDAHAEPMFFMTWAYADKPEMTDQLAKAYTQTGNRLGAVVAPVGLAFAKSKARYPNIALTIKDKRHPTLAGTYLAAAVFYGTLFKETPIGNSYTATLSTEVAKRLQEIAWETVQSFDQSAY